MGEYVCTCVCVCDEELDLQSHGLRRGGRNWRCEGEGGRETASKQASGAGREFGVNLYA